MVARKKQLLRLLVEAQVTGSMAGCVNAGEGIGAVCKPVPFMEVFEINRAAVAIAVFPDA